MKNRLDPIRWSPRRRSRLIRAGGVATLLALAAGVLLSGTGPAAAARCAATARSPAPTRSAAPPGTIPPGKVGIAVRLAQPGIDDLVRPGDHVELTVAAPNAERAKVLVPDAMVLRHASGDVADSSTASVIYVAMTETQARQVAATAPDDRIGITVRPG